MGWSGAVTETPILYLSFYNIVNFSFFFSGSSEDAEKRLTSETNENNKIEKPTSENSKNQVEQQLIFNPAN